MNWYQNNPQEWKEIIELVAEKEHRSPLMIEKDLLQSIFIQRLSNIEGSPLVFKGGTSLSKVYQIINRFSEDIDLSANKKLTESERKNINKQILNIVNNLDMNLENSESIQSRYSYNKYMFSYNSLFRNTPMPIIVETNFYQSVYPVHKQPVHSFIEDFYNKNHITSPITFDTTNVYIKTQSLERTFVDKIFAICDYKIQDKQERDSRHLYDIAKILPYITIDDKLKELVKNVRIDRALSKNNPSAQPVYNIPQMLKDIINSKFYESDYNNLTKKLLYEDYSYDKAIKNGIEIISNIDLFEYEYNSSNLSLTTKE